MKILYLHNSFYNKGKANFVGVLSMCNAFSEHGVDITLGILDSGHSAEEIAQYIVNQYGFTSSIQLAMIPTYGGNGRLAKYLSYFSARKLIKDLRPDVCYVREPLPFKICMNLEANTIFESHNARLHYRVPAVDRFLKESMVKSSKRTNFVRLIAISDALRKFWVRQGINEEKTLCLHDGFTTAFFEHYLSRQEARKKLRLRKSGKLVIYTGSLYRDREMENILHLAEKFFEARFIVIGGPYEEKVYYQKVFAERGLTNVEFVGRVDHKRIPDYLYAADVLLAIWSKYVPTINYCSPLKVFEYMASGRIIVAHGFPTIKEVLRHEETALLANPFSIDDLSDKMRLALSLEYPCSMAENARFLAFQRYTWSIRAKKILESISKF